MAGRRASRVLVPAAAAASVVIAGLGIARSRIRPGPDAAVAAPRPGPAPAEHLLAGAPGVALLVTRPGATSTALVMTRAGEISPPEPLTAFDHGEDAAIQGAVLPGPAIVVLATAHGASGGELFRLTAGQAPRRLAGGLARAARPLITPSGRVFVVRIAGDDPGEVHVDEIDPVTGGSRTLRAARREHLVLAGAAGREILIHQLGPAGAALLAVDEGSGAARVVTPEVSPYARDFSVTEDGRALVFEARDADDARVFTLERVDLAIGARRRLYTGTHAGLAPFAWPGGGVAYSHEGHAGLALLGGTRPLAIAPFGAGVDRVLASAGSAWIAGLHLPPDGQGLPVPFVIDTRTGAAAPVPFPAGARAYVAGFVSDRTFVPAADAPAPLR